MEYLTIDDLKYKAKKKVPKAFHDYVRSGSWTETTLKNNSNDFQKISFRQRVAVDISNRTTKKSLLGVEYKMPVALAPVGSLGMQRADGEILAAQAAEGFGVPFTLSTMSICSIEEVARNTSKPFWFQLYVMRDHDFAKRLVERAKAAQCSALVLTLDLQILGQRHADIRNGLSIPLKIKLSNLFDLLSKPSWCYQMARTKNRTFGNVMGHVKDITNLNSLTKWVQDQFDTRLNWDDVKRIKDWWGGKLIIKGIMDPDDAKMAQKCGADALVVSNHGGRQLDGVNSSISTLPEIKKAVSHMEVLMDGGISSGQDILKAIAMGAEGVMIGRSFVYGLSAGGKEGVTKSLEILNKELDMTMALCGRRDIKDVGRDIIKDCPFFEKN
jgi:L-lactate dehydrogenase (cytochrome)|tara:strand:- start:413 stop:1564 length:1152 start_codon:yes stop_codon:yes gene_type:complete